MRLRSHRVAERFLEAEAYRLAASLSFYSLSSMFPLMIVALAAADTLLGDSAELRNTLISAVNGTNSPALRALLEDTLREVLDHAPEQHLRIIVGLLGAVFGASGIFLELVAAMDKLFRVAPPKGSFLHQVWYALRGRGSAILLVFGTSLVLLCGTVVLGTIDVIAARLPAWAESLPGLVTDVSSVGVTWIFLTLCYRVVPNTRVPIRAAMWGAGVAAIIMRAVRWPVTWVVAHVTTYSAYGVVGTLLVLVTWFYVVSSVLLLGAAWTAVHGAVEELGIPPETRASDPETEPQKDTRGASSGNSQRPTVST
ncbi:MAG TPA: YihY/virulence factor BrkB family protein [Polyangiaceae bacterium]|nr:YihY/virulence factor BrkB family protein [Polyangiaceae bacterium]